jgi:DUF917 family protein
MSQQSPPAAARSRLGEIRVDDLEDLARGAAFLGTGGGGDPYLGRLLAEQMIEAHGPVELLDVDRLPDHAQVYPVAMMGAPTVMLEKLIAGTEIGRALEALERRLGRKADAIVSGEIGGLNSLIPIQLAAERGLPLLDGDGMGRAFPELPMTTVNLHGVACAPMAVANERGEAEIIEAADAAAAEAVARGVVMRMGGQLSMACYAMSGAQAKHAVVRGTISLALAIGRAIAQGRHCGDPFAALLKCLRATQYYSQAYVLFDGMIVDLIRETRRGFAIGRAVIESSAGAAGRLEVEFQNENLLASVNGEVRATVPDLISVLDRDSAEPITTERLRYGQRVKVLAVSAAPIMRSAAALRLFGPAAFGYALDFRPVEELNA